MLNYNLSSLFVQIGGCIWDNHVLCGDGYVTKEALLNMKLIWKSMSMCTSYSQKCLLTENLSDCIPFICSGPEHNHL